MNKISRKRFVLVLGVLVIAATTIVVLLTQVDDTERTKQSANNHAASGEYELAIQEYTRLLENNPADAVAYWNRGNAYYGLQNYEAAIQDYSTALMIDPEYIEAYLTRGSILIDQQAQAPQPEIVSQALTDFEYAIELDPNIPESYLLRGLAYYVRGQHRDAVADETYVIERKPDVYAEAYLLRGASYYYLMETDKALDDLNHALELNSTLLYGHYFLGEIYYYRDDDTEALENYRIYLDLLGESINMMDVAIEGRVERLSTQLSRTPTPVQPG